MAEWPNLGTDDDDEGSGTGSENLVEVRKYAKRLEKQLREAKAEIDARDAKLQEVEARERTNSIRELASKQGLDDTQTNLLLKLKPDAGEEDVSLFAATVGVNPKAEGSEEGGSETPPAEEVTPPAQGSSFQPAAGSSSPSSPYTSQDIKEAIAKDDMAMLERIARDAEKNPNRLQLKNAHLIED